MPRKAPRPHLGAKDELPAFGRWALPGGFVDVDQDRNLLACARRKLKEKTGVTTPYLEQLGSWGSSSRDPRGWSATHAYFALIAAHSAKEGAVGAPIEHGWTPVDLALQRKLAFDHAEILAAALERLRSKVEYTSLPAFLLPEPFTLPQLQRTYEIVLGRELDKSAFRKRMLDACLLEEADRVTGPAGRQAQGYLSTPPGGRAPRPRPSIHLSGPGPSTAWPRPPRNNDPTYPRNIRAAELEERLISICDSRGEQAFLELRDRVKVGGGLLKTPKTRLDELDRLMGAILGTRPGRKMATAQGAGRARGYDAPRMDLFHKLVQVLKVEELPRIADVAGTAPANTHFAFLESYFSNFIEGTEFEIGEARAIALDGKISALRPKDSHDIKGVFDQARDAAWRARGITDIKTFEATLRERHALMMVARPEVLPGEFKVTRNVAGNTACVEPRLVVGTLREAGLLVHDVDAGLPRALLAMFIVSEVHPFNDGNLARLVMNSELSAAGESRIIVPTLYREQYFDGLRELTRAARTEPYLAAMANIQCWTAAFSYEDLDATIDLMTRCNAFEKSLFKHQLLWPADLHNDDQESEPEDTAGPRG